MVTKNHKEVKIIFKQYYVPVKFWFLDQHFLSVLEIYNIYLLPGSKQLTDIAVEQLMNIKGTLIHLLEAYQKERIKYLSIDKTHSQ